MNQTGIKVHQNIAESIAVMVLLWNIANCVRAILIPPSELVQLIPDDTYYYLTLARNFVQMKSWTFDSGSSVTSGFHIAWAYSLTVIYALLQPGKELFVKCAVLTSSLLASLCFIIAWLKGRNKYGASYFLAMSIAASTANFLQNSLSGLEWSLTLLVSGFFFHSLINTHAKIKPAQRLIFFLLGFSGSMARSDFGLVPFTALCSGWLMPKRIRPLQATALPFAATIGAASGVGFVLLHSFCFTGRFLQSSARIKALWSATFGGGLQNAMRLLLSSVGIHGMKHALTLLLILAFLGLMAAINRKHSKSASFITVTPEIAGIGHAVLTSITSILAYTAFYSYCGSIQPWYTANLIVPIFLTLWASMSLFEHMAGRAARSMLLLTAAFVVAVNAINSFNSTITNTPNPHQQFMMQGGHHLASNPLPGRVASWNAGIIGYYANGQVINIDGLVNNDIYDYAKHNRLPQYLKKAHISFIIDFQNMISNKLYRMAGGYDSDDFISSLIPLISFDDGQYHWKRLTLYKLTQPLNSEDTLPALDNFSYSLPAEPR